jgi:hypothetical protein
MNTVNDLVEFLSKNPATKWLKTTLFNY